MRWIAALVATASVVLAAAVGAPAGAQTPPPPNPLPPAATTGAASSVARTTATVNGSVTPNGSATTYHVEYGTSTAYGLRSRERAAGAGLTAVPVAVALSGLTADTVYHHRVVATNAAGIARGADRTLRTTRPPQPLTPVVTSGPIAALAPRGVTLTGTVNARGSTTTHRFEYGVGTSLNRSTGSHPAGAGGAAIAVSLRVVLTPATRYSYRLVATNVAGTTRGARRSFTTPVEISAIALELASRRVVYGDGVTVVGRLRGAGVRNLPVALELQQHPFTGPFKQIGAVQRVGADGTVRFGVRQLVVSSRLRLVTRSGAVSTSRVQTVRTAVRPGLRILRLRGRRVRFSGVVRPAVTGTRVSLQRRVRGRFVTLRRSAVAIDASGRARYRLTIHARRHGAVYRVLVVPPRSSGHVRNGSREVLVRGVAAPRP